MNAEQGLSMLLPQDIAVMAILGSRPESAWTQRDLSQVLHISLGGIHAALKRCLVAELFDPNERRIRRRNLFVVLEGGFQFIFRGELGSRRRGIVTAWSAAPLSRRLSAPTDDVIVWPDPKGETLGQSLEPLYAGAPAAALASPDLHEILSLLDALRLGSTRARDLALAELGQRIR